MELNEFKETYSADRDALLTELYLHKKLLTQLAIRSTEVISVAKEIIENDEEIIPLLKECGLIERDENE